MAAVRHLRLTRPSSPVLGSAVLEGAQRAVVDHGAGRLLVLGGPGTGKTLTLVHAVCERLREGADPLSILVVVPSRQAALAVKEAVATTVGQTSTLPVITTFHGLAQSVVARFAPDVDPADVRRTRLLTAPEQDLVLRDVLAGWPAEKWPPELAAAVETRAFAAHARALWSRARLLGLDPEDLAALGQRHARPAWESAGAFFEEYLQTLDLADAMDYAELMHRARLLLADDANAAAIHADVAHVYVDDFAEVDHAQAHLLRLVAGPRHVVAFADPDQSVFGFRGADPRYLSAFITRWPGGADADIMTLQDSHRMSAPVAAAVAGIARRLPHIAGVPAEVAANARICRGQGEGSVEVQTFDTALREAAHIAAALRTAHVRDQVPWEQMAVIVRAGRRSIPLLARACTAAQVPVDVAGDEIPLAEHAAVQPLLSALSCAEDLSRVTPEMAAELALSPLGGLDAVGWRRLGRALRRVRRREGVATPSAAALVAEVLRGEEPAPDTEICPEAVALTALAQLLGSVHHDLANGGTAHEALWALWNGTSWPVRLRSDALRGGDAGRRADRDLDAVCALFDVAARLDAAHNRGVGILLKDVAAQDIAADTDRQADASRAGVRIVTAHRAKGLEWDLVIVAGVQEGQWPSLATPRGIFATEQLTANELLPPAPLSAQVANERRLFFLACSRARTRLLVTAVADPGEGGEAASAFVEDLGVEVVHVPGEAPPASTLVDLVAELRRVTVDPEASPALKRAAAARLAVLASARSEDGVPLVPLADPQRWWGIQPVVDDPALLVSPNDPVPLSASSLGALLQCPRSWFLSRKVHGERSRGAAASLGTLLHAVAEAAQREEWDLEQIQRQVEAMWDEVAPPAPWQRVRGLRHAQEAMARFHHWRVGNQRTVVGTEVPFEAVIEVPGDRVRLSGRVDRLEATEDGLVVVDLKTGRTMPSSAELPTMDQLGFYQAAVEAGAFDAVAPGIRHSAGASALYLSRSARNPLLPVEKVQPCLSEDPMPSGFEPVFPESTTWIEDRLAQAAAVIRQATYPAQAGTHCAHCAFQHSCPTKAEGEDIL